MYNPIPFVIALSLLFISSANAIAPTQKELCSTVSTLAENSMALRQYGAPISEPLAISQRFENDRSASGAITTKVMDAIIIDAYSQDLRYSEQMKQTSINEFAAKYYIGCMQADD